MAIMNLALLLGGTIIYVRPFGLRNEMLRGGKTDGAHI
jgi:hypothetical protein